MALQLLPEHTFKFTPEEEESADNPLVIHIKPSGVKDSIQRNMLLATSNSLRSGSDRLSFVNNDALFDYVVGRISKIENVMEGSSLVTIKDPRKINDIMNRAQGDWGLDLLVFIIEHSKSTEEEAGN